MKKPKINNLYVMKLLILLFLLSVNIESIKAAWPKFRDNKKIWQPCRPMCFEMNGHRIIARYDLNKKECK